MLCTLFLANVWESLFGSSHRTFPLFDVVRFFTACVQGSIYFIFLRVVSRASKPDSILAQLQFGLPGQKCSQSYLTNRFHVAMRLFSNRSQMTSKCGKNKEVVHEPQANLSLMFLPHFDVLCDLLLNRPMATWNLFVLYNDQKRK